MSTSAIRLARNADARHIANLSRCLIELGLRGWSWHPARVAQAITHRDMCVIVAEESERDAGVVGSDGFAGFAIAQFGETHMHLNLLAVEPAYQRKGVALALMQWLETSALTAGISEMHLELRANNTAALRFYEAVGFICVSVAPGYYAGVEAAVKMHKPLGLKVSTKASQPSAGK